MSNRKRVQAKVTSSTTERVKSIKHLIELTRDNPMEFKMLLNFGVFSRKTIQYINTNGVWFFIVENHIDETIQNITEENMMNEGITLIGKAVNCGALTYDKSVASEKLYSWVTRDEAVGDSKSVSESLPAYGEKKILVADVLYRDGANYKEVFTFLIPPDASWGTVGVYNDCEKNINDFGIADYVWEEQILPTGFSPAFDHYEVEVLEIRPIADDEKYYENDIRRIVWKDKEEEKYETIKHKALRLLGKLCSYLSDEAKSYKECNEEDKKDHIYTSILEAEKLIDNSK